MKKQLSEMHKARQFEDQEGETSFEMVYSMAELRALYEKYADPDDENESISDFLLWVDLK